MMGVLVWMIETLAARTSPTWTMWRGRIRSACRVAWRELNGLDAYHGARYVHDEETIPWQRSLALALGDSNRALIFIRLNQWIEFNKSEGRPATTHNGYDAWIKTHFGHLKRGAFGGHIRALEKMGVLQTQRIGQIDSTRKYDQRKSYRIDHARVTALLAGVKTAVSDTAPKKSKASTRNSKMNTADPSLNNDSKSSNQSLKPNAVTQEPPTKPAGRGGWRPGAGRKPKAKAVTETPAADAAPNSSAESTALEAGTPAAQTPDPSPNSAPPPSHAEAALIGRMADLGLDQDKATALIDQYGADRVRAVVHECARRVTLGTVYSPAGWIIKELEKDIFKLGTLTAEADRADPRAQSLSDLGSDLVEDYPDSPFAQLDPVPVDEAAITRWREALVLLEASMAAIGPAVYFNSVDESVLIGYEPEGAVYRVQTHDRDQARVCRFHVSVIREALEQVHSGSCRVEFEGG